MGLIKAEDVVMPGNGCEIPKDRYTARIKSAESVISKSSQQPQLVIKCEIADQEPVEINGQKFDVNGTEFQIYLPLAEDKVARLFEVNKKLGLPMEIDTEAPDTEQYVGICFDVVLSSEPMYARKTPTGEQVRKGMPGDIIKDREGKDIIQGYSVKCAHWDILGRTEVDVNTPFA